MRHFPILLAAAAVIAAGPPADGGEKKAETHRHPSLPVSFRTYEGWHRVPRPGDEGTLEMEAPGGDARVLVWYTSTEQDAERYLMKMAGMKGLGMPAGTRPDTLETEYHTMVLYRLPDRALAVIDNGRTEARPRENALYIVEIVCSGRTRGCGELIGNVLGTVRVSGEGGP